MQRVYSLEKTLMLGKIEGRGRRGQERTRGLNGITDSKEMSLSTLREMVKVEKCAAVHGVSKESDTCLTPWTVAHKAPLSMEILQARILE